MPYNGAGSFQALPPPTYPAVAGETIRAGYFNAVISDILAGLSTALTKDGQTTPSANLPMGNRKHTGAANAVSVGEYYVYGQDFVTQAADTSNLKPATTAFVLGQLATTTPVAVGSAAVGTSKKFARADHSHALPSALIGQIVSGLWLTAPSGFLELAGQLVSRTTYAGLWAYAQTIAASFPSMLVADAAWAAGGADVRIAFSTGDGSSTFRLPDYRGLVARSWDHARGLDSGRALGSYQDDALQNIIGGLGIVSGGHAGSGAFAADGAAAGKISAGISGTNQDFSFDASRVARTAAETRVKSVALMYCIQY